MVVLLDCFRGAREVQATAQLRLGGETSTDQHWREGEKEREGEEGEGREGLVGNKSLVHF